MSKLQTALTSLVAVIPAGLLTYVLVMGMMTNLDGITGTIGMMIGVGLVMLCCLGVLFTPILVFVVGDGGGDDEPEIGAGGVDTFGDDEFGGPSAADDDGMDGLDDFGDEAETMVADDLGDGDFEDDEWGDEDEWDDEEEDEWK